MAKNHNWRIKREYYTLIDKGIKTLEVRVGYSDIKRVIQGDTITFSDYSNSKFKVTRKAVYENFSRMYENEDISKALPNTNKKRALEMYREIYPKEKERLGVHVFELQKLNDNVHIYTLSSFINNHKLFGKLAQAAYIVTDFICTDYPKHFEWYWTKEIPRVIAGTGEVVIATIDTSVVGVTFLKKESTESKLCTLLVVEGFRNKHIATKLLKEAFKYLGTTKPLITLADYKLPLFEHIIKKYGWTLIQTMGEGYYNKKSRELVFNGKLSQ